MRLFKEKTIFRFCHATDFLGFWIKTCRTVSIRRVHKVFSTNVRDASRSLFEQIEMGDLLYKYLEIKAAGILRIDLW